MNEEKTNDYLDNLIKRVLSSFNDRVINENDSSGVLLKAHLLTENVLEECLAVFDIKK
jgi:hypothetical protein